MTRRIAAAMVGLAAVSVILLGLPLAIAIRHTTRDEILMQLQSEAATAAMSVSVDSVNGSDPVEFPPLSSDTSVGVYDLAGGLVVGQGPDTADPVTSQALGGKASDQVTADHLAVAIPLTSDEQVYGAIRAAAPAGLVTQRATPRWLELTALALAAVLIATGAAALIGRKLARPMKDLTDAVVALGSGQFEVRIDPTGVAEIDKAAEALNGTADRIGDLLNRERSFSADVSHQLRTPLTALKLDLEAAGVEGHEDLAATALAEVSRIEATIEDLLTLARDTNRSQSRANPRSETEAAEQRWHGPFAERGRPLRVTLDDDFPEAAPISSAAIRQILDVLIDNALQHGQGEVTIEGRTLPGGASIDVIDQGPGVDPGLDVFRRRSEGSGSIGLALARTLAEAEEARLLLVPNAEGTTQFRLVMSVQPGKSP